MSCSAFSKLPEYRCGAIQLTLVRLLTIVAVEQVARDWAIGRNRRPAEPATVVFCPVRCESYFNDNGDPGNLAAELFRRFQEVYAAVVTAVRNEAPAVAILYAPMDTIGCVELINAYWPEDPVTGQVTFSATYRFRQPRQISRVGVDNLTRAICKQLVQGRRMLDARPSEILTGSASQAQVYARHDKGFFHAIQIWLSIERSAAEQAARTRSREAQDAQHRIAALNTVLHQIAGPPYGVRTEIL